MPRRSKLKVLSEGLQENIIPMLPAKEVKKNSRRLMKLFRF